MALTPEVVQKIEYMIAEKFSKLRKERGLTQEDFDQEPLGIPARTIQRLESKDVTNLELKTIIKLAFYLGIHPKDLLDVEVPWDKA